MIMKPDKDRNSIDMLNGNLMKPIIIFSVPLMLSTMLQLLFNAADIIVVGKFAGDNALAAVSSTTSLVCLIVNLFSGTAIGVNFLIARYIGEDNKEGISDVVHTAVLFSLLAGIFLAVFGFFISRPALVLMDSPAEIIDLSAIYLKIYFMGSPATLVYNYGAAILRSKGDTKRPLIYLFISGVLNVVLNLIFVIVFKMSVSGVALATIMSSYLSAFLIVLALLHEKEYFAFSFKGLRINTKSLIDILRYGLPAGLQSCLFSLANTVIQSTVNGFGATVIAGNGAASNIESFINAITSAFLSATITFVSQNVGARKYERIKKIYLDTNIGSGLCILLIAILVYFHGSDLLSLYTDDPDVIAAGLVKLRIIAYTYILYSFMQMGIGVVRGLGYSFIPTLVSLVGVCGLRLTYIATLYQNYKTPFALFLCYPISWGVTGLIVTAIMVVILLKDKEKIIQGEHLSDNK